MPTMQRLHLQSVDLNLLMVLNVLLEERNVTRAGARLALSQPATSHALSRLRALFRDPLLVRGPRGMQLTATAERLRAPLRSAIDGLANTLEEFQSFDARATKWHVQIGMTDYVGFTLLPALHRRLAADAPGVDLAVSLVSKDQAPLLLDGGQIDLATGFFADAPRQFLRQHLFRDSFVCLMRKTHPLLKKRLTIERLLSFPHVAILSRGETLGIVDQTLAEQGITRHSSVTTSHYLLAPFLLQSSDLVAMLPRRIAIGLGGLLDLRMREPPIRIPGFGVEMMWHPRLNRDRGLSWLRSVMAEVSSTL